MADQLADALTPGGAGARIWDFKYLNEVQTRTSWAWHLFYAVTGRLPPVPIVNTCLDSRSRPNHRRRQAWAPSVRFHPLEVMEALQTSSDRGAHVSIETRPERPAMLPISLQPGALD
jgi:hypothetical protein